MTGKPKDIRHEKFDRLTPIECLGKNPNKKSNSAEWLCLCDCGNKVVTNSGMLRSGHKRSCGCLATEAKSKACAKRNYKHGLCETKEYSIWVNMITRCENKNDPGYLDYGGRGIKICPDWRESFSKFIEDMGECPIGMSLDRIDVNGDYEKLNCRWATPSIQCFNQRKRKDNKSGATGVNWRERWQIWEVYITINKRQVYVGGFKDFQEACEARKEAELKYYGFNRG